jgi:protein-S-isoprenylcysteine O-methyltransferase Ste14
MVWLGKLAGMSAAIFMLMPGRVSGITGYAGLALFSLSLCLFWSSYFSQRSDRPQFAFEEGLPSRLVETGPYRFIRNPFYASYMLNWLAAPLATRQPWLLLPAALLGLLYYKAARLEESQFGESRFRFKYERYKSRAGRFLPNPTGLWKSVFGSKPCRALHERLDPGQAGGKATQLSHLVGESYPVPPGIVIQDECFREFLSQNRLDERIEEILSRKSSRS